MPFDAVGFHVAREGIKPGSTIQPGNFGQIILRVGRAHNLHQREMLFELDRQLRHPHLPSRLFAAFLWGSLPEARWYQREVLKNDVIYEVRFDPALPKFRAYHLCIPPHPMYSEKETIERYWDASDAVRWSEDASFVPVEILTLSPLLVENAVTL